MSAQSDILYEILPQKLENWDTDGDPVLYDTSTLYDYINGGAELYLSYGMHKVVSQRYAKEGVGQIRLEIFDMVEPGNAFGVFSHTRTHDEKKFGQGSQYFTGAQIFWKGRYFISVMADDENEQIVSAINSLSANVDKRIDKEGELPVILNYLPKDGLVSDGYTVFNHYIWLNSYYFISDDNFFNISAQTNAILAKYGGKDERHYLLIIEYIDEEQAEEAFKNYSLRFLDGAEDKNIEKLEDGSFVGGNIEGNVLVCVFNTKSEIQAREILESARQNILNTP